MTEEKLKKMLIELYAKTSYEVDSDDICKRIYKGKNITIQDFHKAGQFIFNCGFSIGLGVNGKDTRKVFREFLLNKKNAL